MSGLPEAGGVPTEPVARRPLHEGAADRLRDMIIEGRLLPGDRIPEQAI
ncbi:MAG TPA: GntR family transcriptional regulator, partial [Alphaproteobacteria bacterium]|nr:GntR family transcriptional regulator [Alphaproteobacteria bacterium]